MTRLALIAALTAAGCMAAAEPPSAIRSDPLPPRRGAPAADEAAAARTAGSNAALIRYLARHPQAPDAAGIRAALAARRAPDPPGSVTGQDAEVVAGFDAARLAGTDRAWSAFIARHATHPLAAEAARWR